MESAVVGQPAAVGLHDGYGRHLTVVVAVDASTASDITVSVRVHNAHPDSLVLF